MKEKYKCLKFRSSEFNQLCRDVEAVQQHTVGDISHQRDVVKWLNQTLLERARCMLVNAGLDRRLWVEVVSMVCDLVNCGPHTSIKCKI